jgi:hypothetical protein
LLLFPPTYDFDDQFCLAFAGHSRSGLFSINSDDFQFLLPNAQASPVMQLLLDSLTSLCRKIFQDVLSLSVRALTQSFKLEGTFHLSPNFVPEFPNSQPRLNQPAGEVRSLCHGIFLSPKSNQCGMSVMGPCLPTQPGNQTEEICK